MTVDWLAGLDVDYRTDPAFLATRRLDRSGWEPEGSPSAVVLPTSVEQVQRVLQGASASRTPVVPRGAGTALTGATTAGSGTIVLDLSGMNRIVDIRPADGVAVVEPGVITADLDRAAAGHGLRYAPDPASLELSTIGGNIATNAGGLRCAKYGMTRDSVLGLDVVLADGTLISTGRATLKGVAGYDLTGLFVGSEGTLGVVVGATLRLRPLPPPSATIAAAYPDFATAVAASVALAEARVQPVLAELLDRATLRALAAHGHPIDGDALLIVQLDDGTASTDRALAALTPGSTSIRSTTDPTALLETRRQALPAIEKLGRPLIEDIAVPRSRMADAVRAIEDIAARHDVPICTLAHAGDGNIHPIIVAGRHDAPVPEAAQRAADEIFGLALDLGGTVTAEHGIGVLKQAWLGKELGGPQHALQRQIKALFDPGDILNPGKAL
ncbi:FAD-linked oxidase C-terminal domain-containing protein [Actinoplanes sp. NBRC 101535]|uniref:FAD-binding oxidoreductase n=1 Tax=Actinoplanes sp. NBRC 101535 TaxID=3032196 RepID=UPI0024A36299|nr:FAD-linked oxidase C-terminal domain-containing protein [Actinoplanes sp. NBRC 101535]GLY00408.1 FAD-linked oxidase [Actinoplanes sp. NBRC 101535]